MACFWYLVYVIVVAAGSDEFGAHGLLNAFFLMVTDSALYLLRGRGEGSWSPGFTCVLILGVRFLVAAGNGPFWVLGHGAAFLLIGTAVGGEVVYNYLARMSVGRTAAIAYFGHDTDRAPPTDVAGFPEFVLGYLCFVYLVELLAFIFSEPEAGFADINMVADKWPVWVFGILSLIIVLNVTAARATWRAFTLQRRKLLLTAKHFWDRRMGFPYMMAAFTEILLICSGVLIFGMTGSAFLLLLLVFLPLVVVSGGLVLAQWVRNDFRLLEDPIKRKRPAEEEGEDGEEGAGAPEGGPAAEAPSLPAMRRPHSRSSALKITMPTLPLKRPKVKPPAADNQEGKETAGGGGVEPAAATATGTKAGGGKAGGDGDGEGEREDEDAPAGGLDALEAALDEDEAASDPVTMYWWEALRKGALTRADYATLTMLAVHYLLTFIMGLVIGAAVEPTFVGHVLWTLVVTLELTLAPVVKYFNVYYWTTDMKVQLPVGFLFFYICLFAFFGGTLRGSINTDWALFLLAVAMWYPAAVALAAAVFKWRDDGWHLSPFITNTFLSVFVLSLFWFWTVFPWTHGYMQPTLVFLYLAAIALFFYTKHWAENDFYWSPTVRKVRPAAAPPRLPPTHRPFLAQWTRRSVLLAAVIFILIALSADVEAFYFFSVGFLLIMARLCALPLERYAFIVRAGGGIRPQRLRSPSVPDRTDTRTPPWPFPGARRPSVLFHLRLSHLRVRPGNERRGVGEPGGRQLLCRPRRGPHLGRVQHHLRGPAGHRGHHHQRGAPRRTHRLYAPRLPGAPHAVPVHPVLRRRRLRRVGDSGAGDVRVPQRAPGHCVRGVQGAGGGGTGSVRAACPHPLAPAHRTAPTTAAAAQ